MTQKIPISFNKEDLQQVEELRDLLGLAGVYGDFPKAVKFGITLALSTIKHPDKVYSDLNQVEMALLFSSIQRAELKARMLAESQKLTKEAKEV